MRFDKLSVTRRITAFTLGLTGALGSVLIAWSETHAASAYEECNQILVQDIFNKINKSDSTTMVSAREETTAFFESDESTAWNEYQEKVKQAKERNIKIDAEFHAGIYGGELSVGINQKDEFSRDTFSKAFNSAKKVRQENRTNKQSSGQTLVSSYASYTRDEGTVNAWKDCVTRTKETNLYAFASRDRAGNSYVNVMWVPGVLAGSMPSITINFVTSGDDKSGVKIHAKPEEHLAMGSGRNFAVTCRQKCDEGFQVTVNGTLKTGGVATNSFTATVDVPPKPLEGSKMPTIYAAENYQGGLQTLELGEYDDGDGQLRIGNDALRSIKVPKGMVVRLYEHFRFQGRFIDIREDSPSLGSAWNNKTSSIVVYKEGTAAPSIRQVVMFEHANYAGSFITIPVGRHDGVTRVVKPGNGISSALVPKGIVVRLYEQPAFVGSFIELLEDSPQVPMAWNDRAASMVVYELKSGMPSQ